MERGAVGLYEMSVDFYKLTGRNAVPPVMGMRGSSRGCCVDSEMLSSACLLCEMTVCGCVW